MDASTCTCCLEPKAKYLCGICKIPVCKKCVQFVDEDSFSFLEDVPEDLTHGTYCSPCFDKTIHHELETYKQTMARARQVSVFNKKQGKETRWFKRTEEPLRVANCADREETLLRLAFFAAKANFNTLIDVDIFAETVKLDGYTTSNWQGVGIPVQSNSKK